MNKVFENICQMTQEDVKKYVANALNETHSYVVNGDGYVFAQGSFPVLLVAHMDTVHQALPHLIVYNKTLGAISSPTGIGGDDRCGIYMVLEIVKRYNCSVLFCEDEEIGGVGARKFTKSDVIDNLEFNYIIEFDRKGANDAVFYDCENTEFTEFITKEFYREAIGSFSDISIVAPELGCAAVNLSCGYYNAHTNDEYVVLADMDASIEAACKILERTTESDKFEYIEAAYNPNYANLYGAYSCIDSYYLIGYMGDRGRIEYYDTWAANKYEAIGRFCYDNENMTYNDIIEIYCEDEVV